MFLPEEMAELSLLVLARDIEAVTEVIARQGVLHLVDMSYLRREQEAQGHAWQDRAQEYQGIEQRILLMMSALQAPEQGTGAEQELDLGADLSDVQDRIAEIEREVLPVAHELHEHQQRLMELKALADRLEPLADMDIDLSSLRNLRFLHVQIGIVPTANLERLKISLSHIPHIVLALRQEGAGTLVALFGTVQDREVLERAAHSAYFGPISLPEEYLGTPRQILTQVQTEMEAHLAERVEVDRQVAALAERWTGSLQALLWRVRADLVLLRAMDRFGQVRDVYLIAGWIPSRQLDALVQEVKAVTEGRVAVDTTTAAKAGDIRSIPITLNNQGFLRAFQGLVTNYAWPAYGEIDPTPIVAVTFSLMFGMMFGDAGHGLVLALVGLLASSGRVRALARFSGMAPVLLLSGLSAMVFGFLEGSFFGLENVLPVIWLRPLENIMTILLVTVAFGVVVLVTGFLVNMVNGWLARDWRRMLFDRYGLAGLWFYLAVIGVVVALVQGISLPLPLIVGLVGPPVLLILFGEPLGNLLQGHRPLIHDSVGLYLVQAFFEFFEALISYLSNSLSYVRLGAFAVAHGGLSAVVLILGGMAGGPSSLWYWVVLLLGNIFIIGFEGLIVAIQTLRLQYYEFFSKFFTGGGVPYRPLDLRVRKA